ncbi:MAG TPA: A24 family peptidase [Tepidisphaeraceae bacterium]|nr:A24 family peptidase [Tepidisphaeraceae bacterium]
MNGPSILHVIPLLAMLVWASVTDLRERKIRNWLTLTIALTGLTQSFFPLHSASPTQSILGLLAGLGLTIPLFIIGARGGGDVKLMAGVGAWIGPAPVLSIFVVAAVVSMIIVLAQAACQGRLLRLFHNTAVLGINLIHVRQVGLDHVVNTGQSAKSVDWRVPGAVPVLIAFGVLAINSYIAHGG